MKQILITAILVVNVFTGVLGQGKTKTGALTDGRATAPSTTPASAAAVPQLKTEDLLKVRDLQYNQAKRALQMKEMEAIYKQLQEGQAADAARIDEVVRAGAKSAGVDLEKWVFNSDSLKFVAKPAPSPAPETKKPKP